MNTLFISCLFFSLFQVIVSTATTYQSIRSITSVTPSATTLAAYDKLELTVVVDADFDNPYDPDQIRIDGSFESPSGTISVVPAFWYRDYTRSGTSITATNDWSWRIRFTPTEPGTWTYRVTAAAGPGLSDFVIGTEAVEFTVTESDNPGFIRIDSRNPRYFAFDDGSPYFPIGENMAWSTGSVLADYETWMSELSASGGNYARLWMASWGFGIEWNDTGLGTYDRRQDRAYQLDQVFEMARENDIYIMLSLLNHGAWNLSTNPEWDGNPYNAANGGMLDEPSEFATNPEAIRLWNQRLRYIAARWGYSPNLMTWEWWNEINWTPLVNPDLLVPWINQSAAVLSQYDPYNHLITHSGSLVGNETVWSLPSISFTQDHKYDLQDLQRSYENIIAEWLETYPDKPFLMGEFGTAASAPEFDPEAITFHNGLWAAPMNGAAGTAMLWWWDSYIHPFDLTHHFTAVRNFFADEDMGARQWQQVDAEVSEEFDMRVYGLQSDDYALLWAVNRMYTESGFMRAYQRNLRDRVENPLDVEFETIDGAQVSLTGLQDGAYTLEVWDAQTGEVISTEPVEVSGGALTITLPPFSRDLAIKLEPVS